MPLIKQHYLECGQPKSVKLNNWAPPEEILKEIGPLSSKKASIDECISTLKTVFKYSVNTMNPYFLDKLYAGTDPIGQVAELITSILNTNLHVYQVSPVFSVMEVECVKIIA